MEPGDTLTTGGGSAPDLEPNELERLEADLRNALAPTYLLVEHLATGGMGSVFVAREPALKRLVAVKVLSSEMAEDDAARVRFSREAQAIAALSHPNVISIHSVGLLETTGLPYFVMEYVEGGTLADRVESEGVLSVREAQRIVGQVASALEAAHALGVVHRDIKASNILYDFDTSRPIVTDWGIAGLDPSAELDPDIRLTKTGTVLGSPKYMSPEQLSGDAVSTETDIYSLGLLAYELLTGDTPFPGNTPREVMIAHLRDDPQPLTELLPDVDPEFGTVVQRCLAKTPASRPTAAEVARRFSPTSGTALEWPPPGLHHLRSTVLRPVRYLIGASLVLLASGGLMAAAVARDSIGTLTFSLLPVGIVGAIGGLAGILGAIVLAIGAIRPLREAAELGYGWGTITDVLSDHRGDTGALIAGQREYAILTPEERRRFQMRRRYLGAAYVVAGLTVLPGVLAIVAFATGSVAPLLLGLCGLPLAAGVLVNVAIRAREAIRLRHARKVTRSRTRPKGLYLALVAPWHRAMALVTGSKAVADGPTGRVWIARLAGVGLAVVAGLGFTVLVPVLSVSAAGPIVAYLAVPSFSVTQERYLGAMAVASFVSLQDDRTVSVAEAEAALAGFWAPGGLQRPSGEPGFDDSVLFAETNPLPPYSEIADSVITMAARGLSAEQEEWIWANTTHPHFARFADLARADFFEFPVLSAQESDGWWFDRQFPRWSAVRNVAYWKVLRAAGFVSEGQTGRAETELREIGSVGLLFVEGEDLITNLNGGILVNMARHHLLELYDLTGRTEEAAGVRQEYCRAVPDEPGCPSVSDEVELDPERTEALGGAPGQSIVYFGRALEEHMLEIALDDSRVRGMRWEMTAQLPPMASCMGPRRVLFGPDPASLERFSDVRQSLVRGARSEALFRTIEEWQPRAQRSLANSEAMAESWWMPTTVRWTRFAGAVLRNPRVPACAAWILVMATA